MVRNAKELNPHEAVEAAKERLREAMRQAGREFNQGIDHTQDRILDTLSSVGQQVEDTASQLSQTADKTLENLQTRWAENTQKPIAKVRERPLEAVAVAALAGLILGMLTHRGRTVHPSRPNHSEPPTTHNPAPSIQHSNSSSSLLSGVLAGGLGKMLWDTVQQEYLTPQNVRAWIRGLLGSKPSQP